MDSGTTWSWTFPAVGESAAAARHLVREALRDVQADSLEVVLLLTSELVTNGVRYGLGPVEVGLRSDDAEVRVTVHDRNPATPSVQTPDLSALNGRGMLLVESLASEWGVDRASGDDGKDVWFTVRTGTAAKE